MERSESIEKPTTILLNPYFLLPIMPKKAVKREVVKPAKKKAVSTPIKSPQKKSKNNEKLEVYPDEEQGILKEETLEEKKRKVIAGDKNDDIYTEEGQEVEVEEDEIEPWEEGFMKGASGPGQLAKDALTGKPLMDVEDVVEMEINGKLYRFASQRNAEKFREKLEQEKKKGKRS